MTLESEGDSDAELRSSSERDTPPPPSLEVLVELEKAVEEPEPLRGGGCIRVYVSEVHTKI